MIRRLAILPAAFLLTGSLPPRGAVEDVAWLAGSWRTTSGAERWAEEFWTPQRGKVMLGSGFSGGAGVATSFEQMRIHHDRNGYLTFTAQPNGGQPVSFRYSGGGPRESMFDNVEHDYPQRIRYRRTGDQLEATTSLVDGSKAQRWIYKRVAR